MDEQFQGIELKISGQNQWIKIKYRNIPEI